jgi:hypothetical protein
VVPNQEEVVAPDVRVGLGVLAIEAREKDELYSTPGFYLWLRLSLPAPTLYCCLKPICVKAATSVAATLASNDRPVGHVQARQVA